MHFEKIKYIRFKQDQRSIAGLTILPKSQITLINSLHKASTFSEVS